MWADDGLSLCKLKVFPHDDVEQGSSFSLCGTGAVVAALEDLVAETSTEIGFSLEEGAGELQEDTTPRV